MSKDGPADLPPREPPGSPPPSAPPPSPGVGWRTGIRPGRDWDGSLSLAVGITGLVASLTCWCLSPILLALNLFGLVLGLRAHSPVKTAARITNGLAIAIELVITVCQWA